MDTLSQTSHSGQISDNRRYARCIQTSKRVRWDLDEDVIRGRHFDTAQKFLPDGLSLADAFTTCDQHFCASITPTLPNRLYLWTGTVRERPSVDASANVTFWGFSGSV